MDRKPKKITFVILIYIAFAFGGIIAGIFLSILGGLPEVKKLEDYRPFMATTVYDRDGRKITQWYVERRSPVPLDEIPEGLKQAVVAVEDKTFFEHGGLDWRGIIRAALANIKTGRIVQGGSTITQQLSKVLFLTPEKSFNRKAKEALLSIQIERVYNKKEILNIYLNQIYYGSGAYGVQSAAQTFFGKDVSELNLPECALIAGLPKAPHLYSPFFHPEQAIKRRSHVLFRMMEEGVITPEEFKETVKSPLGVIAKKEDLCPAPYFIEKIRLSLEEKLGPNLVYNGGLHVYTTLDLNAQQIAEEAVAKGIEDIEKRRKERGLSTPEDIAIQAALIGIDPQNGGVICQIGGRDFHLSKFNRATQAKRQPGSAFKPIVYAAAIQNGFTPSDIIIDSPVIYNIPGTGRPWKPENFGKKFYGPTTLRRALEQSINVATVKLTDKIGVTTAINYARLLGITSPLKPYLSLALGAFEVSLEELTFAYIPLANMGIKVSPAYIRYVTDYKGEMIYRNTPEFTQVIDPATAYIMTCILQGAVENGTGRAARDAGAIVAGKTGTTNDFTDAWFIGYSPHIVAGVWAGFDQKISIGPNETGSRAACPIWTYFMKGYLSDKPVKGFKKPDDVLFVPIDPDNGLRVTKSFSNSIIEVFKKGTEPVEYSRSEAKDWIGPEDYYLTFID
ncbi:PBP1A family penicillin-binding protein [bacterium]|nr:PBP1A family penicillin-binding protein [bacterium]